MISKTGSRATGQSSAGRSCSEDFRLRLLPGPLLWFLQSPDAPFRGLQGNSPQFVLKAWGPPAGWACAGAAMVEGQWLPARLNMEYLSESKYMSGPRQEMHGRESRVTGVTCLGIVAGTGGSHCTGGDGRRDGGGPEVTWEMGDPTSLPYRKC